ncbi:MAG: VWA domain-containing protein, partial [Planctomycetota bacterium]
MKRQIAVIVFLLMSYNSWVFSQEVYTDNVVIVLDASGSMKEMMKGTRMVKMTAAKQALHQVLQHVPETTHIGLLVFSAANVRDPWVYPLGPRDEDKLKTAINLPRPSGGT